MMLRLKFNPKINMINLEAMVSEVHYFKFLDLLKQSIGKNLNWISIMVDESHC